MKDVNLYLEVMSLLSREAMLLDQKQWRGWLDLFTRDVEFWAPAWASETELTNDPANELSLIYIRGRGGLEDRIFRIDSGDSFASAPLDRTVHVVGSVLLTSTTEDLGARASWIAHSFGVRGQRSLAGQSTYTLVRQNDELRISRKRIDIVDDGIHGPVDLYHI